MAIWLCREPLLVQGEEGRLSASWAINMLMPVLAKCCSCCQQACAGRADAPDRGAHHPRVQGSTVGRGAVRDGAGRAGRGARASAFGRARGRAGVRRLRGRPVRVRRGRRGAAEPHSSELGGRGRGRVPGCGVWRLAERGAGAARFPGSFFVSWRGEPWPVTSSQASGSPAGPRRALSPVC